MEGGGGADRIAGIALADVSHVYQENMSLACRSVGWGGGGACIYP
jgi:hypothetical protein